MLTTLATLAALALMQQTDTTVPVRAGEIGRASCRERV